jgi:hypothetical protein
MYPLFYFYFGLIAFLVPIFYQTQENSFSILKSNFLVSLFSYLLKFCSQDEFEFIQVHLVCYDGCGIVHIY